MSYDLRYITFDLFNGFGQNIFLFVLTLLLSMPLGLLITFCTTSKFRIIKAPAKLFIWVIRGTPLMLQLLIVLYAPGLLLGMPFRERMTAALIAFVINYAAYFSEVYRGGIEGVPHEQFEAGRVLGMTERQVFFKIILPQVIKRITAPVGNEVITLVKDTALSRIIGIPEIIISAERYTSGGLIWPLFYTGVYFLALNGIVTLLFSYFEKKLDYYRI